MTFRPLAPSESGPSPIPPGPGPTHPSCSILLQASPGSASTPPPGQRGHLAFFVGADSFCECRPTRPCRWDLPPCPQWSPSPESFALSLREQREVWAFRDRALSQNRFPTPIIGIGRKETRWGRGTGQLSKEIALCDKLEIGTGPKLGLKPSLLLAPREGFFSLMVS